MNKVTLTASIHYPGGDPTLVPSNSASEGEGLTRTDEGSCSELPSNITCIEIQSSRFISLSIAVASFSGPTQLSIAYAWGEPGNNATIVVCTSSAMKHIVLSKLEMFLQVAKFCRYDGNNTVSFTPESWCNWLPRQHIRKIMLLVNSPQQRCCLDNRLSNTYEKWSCTTSSCKTTTLQGGRIFFLDALLT